MNVHGFTIESGQELPHWGEFSEYFERRNGRKPDLEIAQDKELFEYFVEGGFQEFNRLCRDVLHP